MIQPGEEFTIDVDGEPMTVHGLTLSKQRRLARSVRELAEMEEAKGLEPLAMFDKAYECLEAAVGEERAVQLEDRFNVKQIMELCADVLNQNELSVEDKKKQESQPS